MKRLIKKEDMTPFLLGATLLGTGGGGEAAWGQAIMENDFQKGRAYALVDPEDVPDDAMICSGGIMGSVKTFTGISYTGIVQEWEDYFPLVEAIREMEKLQGRKMDYLIPFEIGGLNSPVVFSAAARLGIPCINGDGVGRAAPETQMTSFIGNGIDLYPMPLVDRYGNTLVVSKANDPTYADEVGRYIVMKGGGMAANAHYAMNGAAMKRTCVPHIMTQSLDVGNAMLDAASPEDAISAVLSIVNGKRLFTGIIHTIEGLDKGGFYLTDLQLTSDGAYAGQNAKLVIKNETMALWVNGQIKAVFPDHVYMMDTSTGRGVATVELQQGMNLTLLGCACPPQIAKSLESDVGKVAFGPSRYGYDDLAYVPFDTLNK